MPSNLRHNPQPTTYHVFHDESGNIGQDKWFLTGLVLIEEENLREVTRSLRDKRRTESDPKEGDELYKGEIHFSDLEKFARDTKSRVAKKWFLEWYQNLKTKINVSINLFNQEHSYWDQDRFSQDYLAYNKITSMSLDGFLSYNLNHSSPVEIVLHSDRKDRRPTDNFEEYIEEIVKNKLDSKSNLPPVEEISSNMVETKNHREKFSEESELVQLCDLLMGGCRTSVTGNSTKEAKVWMGRSFSHIISSRNSGNCPVGQSNLNLSLFPGTQEKTGEKTRARFSSRLTPEMKSQKPRRYQDTKLGDF